MLEMRHAWEQKLGTMPFVTVKSASCERKSAADFLPLIVEERHCLSARVSRNNRALLLHSWIVVCRRDCVPAHASTFRDVRMYLGCPTLLLLFFFGKNDQQEFEIKQIIKSHFHSWSPIFTG